MKPKFLVVKQGCADEELTKINAGDLSELTQQKSLIIINDSGERFIKADILNELGADIEIRI